MARDYYEILGIGKTASADEIKNAYRELALKFHPDRNPSKTSEEKFKEINEAYAVLGDQEKRQQYDSYGPDAFNQRYTTEDIFRNFDFNSVFKDMGFNFGPDADLFSQMFGFSQQQNNMDIGNDLLANVSVTLEEVAHGTSKGIRLRHIKACERCGGKGNEPGTKLIKCDRCNGAGQMRDTRRTPFGIIQTVSACQKCRGTGKAFEKSCKSCGGRGSVQAEEHVNVTIPKGVMTGTRLRLKGMGDYGKDRRGDLYIDIHEQRDRRFIRDGDNIRTDLHVPLHIALLGGAVVVPTIDGEKRIEISEGTQNNSKVTIGGAGIPHFNGSGEGDEILNVIVDIPRHLTGEQKDLIKKAMEPEDGKKKFGLF